MGRGRLVLELWGQQEAMPHAPCASHHREVSKVHVPLQALQPSMVIAKGQISPWKIKGVPVGLVIYTQSEPGRNLSNNHPRTIFLAHRRGGSSIFQAP